jgi:CRP/FNR family cyclic AMP-dependent transcriptional regulator
MIFETIERQPGPAAFVSSVGVGRRVVQLEPEQCFFVQGDPADSVFCLQAGRARISIALGMGKQATITFPGPGDFLGEESLAIDAGLRTTTATAANQCTALKISREDMFRMLH